jgi:hypothetical protein
MQKDFMAMAQGQQAPAATQQITEEDINEIGFSSEDFETMGMPGGDDIDSVKQRLMMLLEQSGLMEMFQEPAQQQQLATLMNELAQAMVDQDIEKIQNSKLFQLIQTSMEESGGLEELQQPTGGPVPQQGGTKDFASMMPPTPGGGMGGR